MQYQSTRDKNLKASSAQAILNGLAPDGGLYTMSSFDEVKFDYTTVQKDSHDIRFWAFRNISQNTKSRL